MSTKTGWENIGFIFLAQSLPVVIRFVVKDKHKIQDVCAMAFYNSIYNQFLSLLSRHTFNKIEKQYSPKRQPKKFSQWAHFVYLSQFYITERKSFRACTRNMNTVANKLSHIGVKPVTRSTFSDANNKRPYQFYAKLFQNFTRYVFRCRLKTNDALINCLVWILQVST